MLRLVLALFVALYTTTATAEHPLPAVPEGLVTTSVIPCTDNDTGESGECSIRHDAEDNTYIVFRQEGNIMFIRQIYTDGRPFIDLWVDDLYNTF